MKTLALIALFGLSALSVGAAALNFHSGTNTTVEATNHTDGVHVTIHGPSDVATGTALATASNTLAGNAGLFLPTITERQTAPMLVLGVSSTNGWVTSASTIYATNVGLASEGSTNASVAMTGTSGLPQMTKTITATNLADNGGPPLVRVRYFVDDVSRSNMTSLSIYIADGTWANYGYSALCDNPSTKLRACWNTFIVPPSVWTYTGTSGAMWSNVVNVRLRFAWAAGKPTVLWSEVAFLKRYPKAAAVLTFDDSQAVYYNVAAYAASKGVPCTFYVIPSYVGGSGMLTVDQLQQMRQAGHFIASHGYNHLYWSTNTDDAMRGDLLSAAAWMRTNGFMEGGFFAALPGGTSEYQSNGVSKVVGRSVAQLRLTTPPKGDGAEFIPVRGDLLYTPAFSSSNNAVLSISNAIQWGGVALSGWHATDATNVLGVIDYLAAQRAAGLIDVLTVNELLNLGRFSDSVRASSITLGSSNITAWSQIASSGGGGTSNFDQVQMVAQASRILLQSGAGEDDLFIQAADGSGTTNTYLRFRFNWIDEADTYTELTGQFRLQAAAASVGHVWKCTNANGAGTWQAETLAGGVTNLTGTITAPDVVFDLGTPSGNYSMEWHNNMGRLFAVTNGALEGGIVLNGTLRLPSGIGTVGQVLMATGSGLSWTNMLPVIGATNFTDSAGSTGSTGHVLKKAATGTSWGTPEVTTDILNTASNHITTNLTALMTNSPSLSIGTLTVESNSFMAGLTVTNGTNISLTVGAGTTTNLADVMTTHSSAATADGQTLDLSVDRTLAITNAVAGGVIVLLTNIVDRKTFVLRAVADGTPRVFAFATGGGTVNWIATNGVTSGTNWTLAAGKIGTLVGRVWVMAGTTNIDVFGNAQP